LSSLRIAPVAGGRSDAELMRKYVESVFDRMKNAGLVKAGSDVSIGEIRGMGGFDSDAISKYQRKLGHETDNIMARVVGLTDEELEAVKVQRETLVQQAMGKIPEPEPPPVIPDTPQPTQGQFEEADDFSRGFQNLFEDTTEPPKVQPPPKVSQADDIPVNRVIKDGLLNMFSDITDLRYDQVLKEAGRVNFSQEDSVRGITRTIAFDEIAGSRTGMKLLAGMAAVGAAGAFLSNFGSGEANQKDGISSLRTMNYQKWLETQKSFYGMNDERKSEGMSHSGIGSIMRKFNSDFGSPYQGPAYSFTVFEQQGLLQERENYLRQRFSKVHYTQEGSIGKVFDKIRLGSIINRVSNSAAFRDNYDLGSGLAVNNVSLSGISRDANLVKLNLENYRIEVSDADTITLRSKGPNNALTSFFGMNSAPISIRLAGIDAPETAHADRAAQPFAEEAKGALQAMLSGSRNVSIYVDRGNVTYGRQVGHVMVDDKNASLELLRRGYVSYLPFKGKGQQQSYDMRVFNSASKLSQGNDYGMWGNPYFQAYRDIVKSSGNTITFNTLVNTEKVAESANLMNVYSLMNTAAQMGMYNSTMAMEAAAIGADISEKGLGEDYKSPIYFGPKTAPHKSYMLEMLNDMSRMMETKGAKISNKLKVKEVANLNKSMAIDSTGVTNSIYNKRNFNAEKIYGAESNRRYRRRQVMAMAQKNAHRQMQAGPIGHHRM
jgi:endonuclease YncB( thermonuclease family)